MKCLIVTAHPLSNSLCEYLASRATERLRKLGHSIVVENLYEQKFQPVLTPEERLSYYNGPYVSSGVEKQALRLLEAEGIVLVFPTWWFGFPAILKGWFDRVWGPGIAYDHAVDFGPIKPRIKKLRQVLVVTTLGASWWVDWLVMRRPVKKIVKLALLGACAKNSRLRFMSLYNCENLKTRKVEGFCSRIEKELSLWQ